MLNESQYSEWVKTKKPAHVSSFHQFSSTSAVSFQQNTVIQSSLLVNLWLTFGYKYRQRLAPFFTFLPALFCLSDRDETLPLKTMKLQIALLLVVALFLADFASAIPSSEQDNVRTAGTSLAHFWLTDYSYSNMKNIMLRRKVETKFNHIREKPVQSDYVYEKWKNTAGFFPEKNTAGVYQMRQFIVTHCIIDYHVI